MDEIQIVTYDETWPALFDEEAARLQAALGTVENGGLITRTEHFGSTSVPRLAAKPVIDILLGVSDLQVARNAAPILDTLGYAYWADNPRDHLHLFFVRGLPPAPRRTHHLHVAEPGSPFWERLYFRDYLRAHPETRDEYAALKYQLSKKFTHDREAYTQAKGEFIREIMEKAQAK